MIMHHLDFNNFAVNVV